MTVEIDVYRFGAVVAKVLVDDQDAYLGEPAHLGNVRWCLGTHGYAQIKSGPRDKRKCHLLHREIMGNPPGMDVDHINGDGLDCRRTNLRVTDRAGNNQNRRGPQRNSTTRVRGVFPAPSGGYIAKAQYRGEYHHIGTFATIEEASRAVSAKRKELGFLSGAESEGPSDRVRKHSPRMD